MALQTPFPFCSTAGDASRALSGSTISFDGQVMMRFGVRGNGMKRGPISTLSEVWYVRKLLSIWDGAEYWLIGILALTMSFLMVFGVLSRYVFNLAVGGWLIELILYMAVWAAFLSVSPLVRDEQHISATIVVEKLPLRLREVLYVVNNLLGLGFCVALTWLGFSLVSSMKSIGQVSTTGVSIPLWIPHLIIPIMGTLSALRFVQHLYRILSTRGATPGKQEPSPVELESTL